MARNIQGYPLSIFQGTNTDKKFLCGLCQLVLRDPYQRFCGHRFCKPCLDRATLNGETLVCQQCIDENTEDVGSADFDQSETLQMFPDKAIQREMALLLVQCYACEWTGKFKDFTIHVESQHRAINQLCQFGCGKELAPDADLDEHVRNQVAVHFEVVFSKVTELESRVAGQTATTTTQVSAAEVSKLSDRLSLLDQSVSAIKTRVSDASLKMQNLSLEPTAAIGASAEDRNVADKMDVFEGCLTVLNREVEGLSTAVDSSTRQRQKERELLESIDRKVKNLDRMVVLKEATIVELTTKVSTLESTSYDGTLVWAITEVAKKRQEAVSGQTTSIYSPHFFTSRTGYKMCLRAYLNGDGMGKGTHLSVFFVIMRGTFDALLRWPFRQRVSLTLLNQAGKDNVTDAFRPDPASSSFKRPTTDMNIASGCPLFASTSVLTDPNAGFIKEDKIFLRAVVDISDLS